MIRTEIKKIYENYTKITDETYICGFVKSIRSSKNVAFISIADGSCFKPIQIVLESEKINNFSEITKLGTGASICVTGKIVITENARQPFEISATKVEVEGTSTPDYPLQKKAHSLEFLRTIPHLRMRTNTFQAVFKIRSVAAQSFHKFFAENGFFYAQTPIITKNDCEGAGEMFRVTSLDLNEIPSNEDGSVNFSEDFFGTPASLTVSGQLEGECAALSFGKIYTFGPTFRAEKSNTPRHAAEFWMIEPEIAFADLEDDMILAENMLKFVIAELLEKCHDELEFCNNFYDKNLLNKLEEIINSEFKRCSYTKAVEILKNSGENFEYPVFFGADLQTEHERYLTEKVFAAPVFITDYPKEIKAFYMRQNDDGITVAAMDLLVPSVGELIGGSQREERLDLLISRMEELGLSIEDYSWYLDLRRFGGTHHAGFGLGFERFVMFVTGISNIRDVSLFPRTSGTIS